MKEYTKEELMKFRDGNFLTVGDMKKFFEKHNMPDDALVVVQRVEDRYFERGHGVYLKKGESYYNGKQWNEGVDNGDFLQEDEAGDVIPRFIKKHSEEELHLMKDQYYPVWSCVRYNDDRDVLFIDAHY